MESRAGNGGVVREQTWLSTKRDEKLWKAMRRKTHKRTTFVYKLSYLKILHTSHQMIRNCSRVMLDLFLSKQRKHDSSRIYLYNPDSCNAQK